MEQQKVSRRKLLMIAAGVILTLAGCGGGGGGGTSLATSGGTIGGNAVKGPVSGATVTAYSISSGMMGVRLGSASTDSQGNFSMAVGDYTGPVMLQMGGGTYLDEATGTTMAMAPGDVMTAVVSSSTGSELSGIQITPLTSMAQALAQHMAGGMTAANIAAANTMIGAYFMVSDILHTKPMNPLVTGSGTGATQDARNYGMTIAAMTEYAKTVGMTDSSGIVSAMMSDASDGVMNGMTGSTQITMGGAMMGGGTTMMSSAAGTSGLADAMTSFIGSAMNRSGLTVTDMQALINTLNTCTGQLSATGTIATGGTGTGSGGTTVMGTVFNGPVHNGTVMAIAISGGSPGAQLASAPTDTNGRFTLSLGSYSGPVLLQMSGASYTDLATGLTTTMSGAEVMTAVISSVSSGGSVSNVQVTPLTSMAQALAQNMTGGMSDANIAAANTALGAYFMVSDILHDQPMDPLATGSGAVATQDERNYGMSVAAMLQYAQTIGLSDPSAIISAMMSDASDGVMNGMAGSTQIVMGGMMGGGMMGGGGGTMMSSNAGTSGLATAMTTFAGSTMNRSGLSATDMQALITKLNGSTGTIQ